MKLMDKLELIDIIRNEAISLGLNPDNYTAALYSTAGEESSFDPTARQVLSSTASQEAKNLRVSQSDDEFLSSTIRGKGFGLFQLDGISKNGFYNWTKENNLNPNSPEAQVRFLLLDSTGNLDTKYNGGSFLGTTNAKNLASTMENITPEKAAIEFRGKYIKPQVFDAAEQQQQLSHLLDLKKVIDNLEYTGEVVVNPDNNPDNNLPDVDPTNELTPEATDTSNVTDEKTIRDTGLTVKDTEKPSGKYPFIPDFLENLFSPSEEKSEPIIPQSVQEAENFDAVRKMHSEKNFNEGGLSLSEQMDTIQDPAVKQAKRRAKERTTDKTELDKLKDVAKFGAEFIPGVGEAMAVKRVSDAMDEKDYVGAGIETAAGALGLIPVVGDMAGKGVRALKKAEDTVPVFPKPERMFPEGERPKGGKYLNPITGEDLTGKNVPSANIKINPDGKPSFNVTNKNVEEVGTKGKGNTQIKTNLFKSKAGWKWKTSDIDTDNINTLISVNNKGKHYYTLETDFSKGVNLKNYPEQKTEPKLRPTVQGQLELGKPIGTISVRGVEHPVYDKVITFAEGGAVPMKEQMSMFEDGGLMDEGNTIDPISGNDVPPGSTQEEVRDDIPAQLSEGEFVFPADVVRYIGLEKLMQMRQQAKMGLQTMDDMGQMGNSDEAIMSDTIPFELSDLDIQDETEYNNDTVEMATGGLTGPATGIAGFVPSQVPATSFVQQPQAPVTVPAPQQATTVAPKQQQTPTFTPEDMKDVSYSNLFSNSESAPQTLDIINPTTGERRTITFIPGVTPIPEGFIKASESTAPAQETSVTPTVGQAQVREETRDDARRDATERAKFEEATARKKIIAEMFGDKYLTENNAKPFSDILGKQEPGTVTTGGYIVGDNGELLNPETGEQEFFGRDGYMIPLGLKDKPKLDLSVKGGVNRRFIDNFKFDTNVGREQGRLRRIKDQQEKSFNIFKQSKDGKKLIAEASAKKEERDAKPTSTPKQQAAMDAFNKQVARAREQEKKPKSKPASYSSVREKQSAQNFKDYFGLKEGGLASKPKPKPKKMRSGGLASKK